MSHDEIWIEREALDEFWGNASEEAREAFQDYITVTQRERTDGSVAVTILRVDDDKVLAEYEYD